MIANIPEKGILVEKTWEMSLKVHEHFRFSFVFSDVCVKRNPNWKKKYAAKSNFISSSCPQSDFMIYIVYCFMLLVWWEFF